MRRKRLCKVAIGLSTLLITAGTLLGAPAQTITADDGSEMVLIPAGPAIMGTAQERPREAPPHQVNLPDYYIDKYEVTNAQYAKFVQATGHTPPPSWKGNKPTQKRENLPIGNINWFDAMKYAAWAGKRLPTEAEWVKAGRGTDGRIFPWGNDQNKKKANIGADRIMKGGSFPEDKSPFGMMDMAGNVREWTADWYQGYPGTKAQQVHFGKHWKVVRGSSSEYYYAETNDGKLTKRTHMLPYGAHDYVGFRCVKDVDPNSAPYDIQERIKEAESILHSFDRQPVELSYEKEFKKMLNAHQFDIKVHGEQAREAMVRTGIPFSKGAIQDASEIRVTPRGENQALPLQTRVISTWDDDSVRWVLLHFPGQAGAEYTVRFDGQPAAANLGQTLEIDQSVNTIKVNNGTLNLTFSTDNLLEQARCDGYAWFDGMRIEMTEQTDNGPRKLHALPAQFIDVEHPGKLYAVILLKGYLGDENGEASDMAYQIRAKVRADSPRINVFVTLTYMAPRKNHNAKLHEPLMKVADARVVFERSKGPDKVALALDRQAQTMNPGDQLQLRQKDGLRFEVTRDGKPAMDGECSLGWLAVPSGQNWLAMGVRYFWQNHPGALMVEPDAMTVRMWAGDKPCNWEATLAKTHEIVLDAIASPQAGFNMDPLRVTMPPAWACGTEALGGPMLPLTAEALKRFPYWELMREASMREFVKSMPSGFRHFGDKYLGGPYKGKNAYLNLEYDISYNFLQRFLRTGKLWYLEAAEPMARHQADIDTDHTTGQPYKHSPLHTTTYADIAHMFLRGMLTHYLLTGEQRSLDVAEEIGGHIAARTMRMSGYGNERQIGWGLLDLTGLYDVTRKEKYLKAAVHLTDHLASTIDPRGKFAIRYDNRIAFMNGLAMYGMLTVYNITGNDQLIDAVLKVADRTLGLYQEYACRTLNAYCWALKHTNDPRYLDVLERTWQTSMEYLRGSTQEGTFSWHFPYFAAKYQLFPLFDKTPEIMPDPETWRGLQLKHDQANLYLKCKTDSPAGVMVLLKGLVTGTVKLYDINGQLVEAHELTDTDRLFNPVTFALQGKDHVYRLELDAPNSKTWQIHHDAGTDLVVCDPTYKMIHELKPRAYGFVKKGAEKVRAKVLVEGEGFHMATLYDKDGGLRAINRFFIDFKDPGRYAIEVEEAKANLADGDIWSLEIHDGEVSEIEGFLPYWADSPDQLFNPEWSAAK